MTTVSLKVFTLHVKDWSHRPATAAFGVSVLSLILFLPAVDAFGQTSQTAPPLSDLKKLSIEELQAIEVTSVSRRAEKLAETASAIQVITQEDIQRSGATSLPEALRLASNLEVAQVDSRQS